MRWADVKLTQLWSNAPVSSGYVIHKPLRSQPVPCGRPFSLRWLLNAVKWKRTEVLKRVCCTTTRLYNKLSYRKYCATSRALMLASIMTCTCSLRPDISPTLLAYFASVDSLHWQVRAADLSNFAVNAQPRLGIWVLRISELKLKFCDF